MSCKIILSSEPGSAKFTDRVLIIGQEEVRVARSSAEEKADTYNAVFDCRVLSKSQAVFTLTDGTLCLADMGSSNGTFINNLRLSKAGQRSEEVQIFSQDIIRFGSQVEMSQSSSGKARCIVARIRIYLSDGTEFAERPATDKFFRPRADITAKEKNKEVTFSTPEVNIEDKVDQLEKMIMDKLGKEQEGMKDTVANLEKRLKRKQNENQNLLENISKISEDELQRVAEIYDLKEALDNQNKECEKLADDLAVKMKEQIENIKVKDLESELEETRKVLKCTTEEIWLLKEKSRVEEETSKKKDKQISKLSISLSDIEEHKSAVADEENVTHIQMKTMLKDCWEKLESSKVEIKQLNEQLDKVNTMLKGKDMKIKDLMNLVEEDKEQIKMKDEKYLNLKSLVDEENENVDKVTLEMTRLLKIIADDQEIIFKKDKLIDELNVNIGEKDKDLKEVKDTNEVKIAQYSKENLEMKNKIIEMTSKNELQTETFKIEIENQKRISDEKENEIQEMKASLEKQEQIFSTYESLKSKIKDSMWIIEQKSLEIERIQNSTGNQPNIDVSLSELKEQNVELEEANCESRSAIMNLEKVVEEKNKIIAKNIEDFEKYKVEIENINSENSNMMKNNEKCVLEKENLFRELKGIKEKHHSEVEIAKTEIAVVKNDNSRSLRLKEEEIEKLETDILKEKQRVAHVQLNQEKEILEKEGEIRVLNTILTQERKILLEKEEEVGKLKIFRIPFHEYGVHMEAAKPAPSRPPRAKSMVVSANMKVFANIPVEAANNDNESDTVTFHDALNNDLSVALSDEEDVRIEDLELDEETDDMQHRRSDINFEQFG